MSVVLKTALIAVLAVVIAKMVLSKFMPSLAAYL